MTKIKLLLSIFIAGLMLFGCTSVDLQSVAVSKQGYDPLVVSTAEISDKYIVVLNENVDPTDVNVDVRKEKVKSKAQGLLKKYAVSGDIEETFQSALNGFTVRLTPGHAKQLEKDNAVKSIELDGIISLSPIYPNGKPIPAATSPTQVIPWGVTRVGGGSITPTGTAWIIDSGIDLTHPDLNVDQARSASFLGGGTTANDEFGHGTHVAGIIGALNNSVGVVGVAPGAKLVSVRVLDAIGNGTTSGVIAGIDYVAQNAAVGDVANLSLGGAASDALDQAVLNASAKVKFVIAAGNNSASATNYSPARVNGANIYTVSAMDKSDRWASFSNYGNPPIDYCAPGVSIYSTYMSHGYATLSGTSMAAPHVAGLLLIGAIQTNGYVRNDPDKNPDPIAHH